MRGVFTLVGSLAAGLLITSCVSSSESDLDPASTAGGGGAGGAATGGSGGTSGSGSAGVAGVGGGSAALCEDFTACGGELVGTWRIEGSCTTGDPAEAAYASSGVSPLCRGLFSEVSLDVTGTVTYDGSTETSSLTMTTYMTVVLTEACLAEMNGSSAPITVATCADFEDGLHGEGQTGTCTFDGTSQCICDMATTQTATPTPSGYTVSGGQVIYDDPTSEPVGYCVEGTSLRMRGSLEGSIELELQATRVEP